MGLKLDDRSFRCSDVSAQIKDHAFNEKVRVYIFLFRLQLVLTSHKIHLQASGITVYLQGKQERSITVVSFKHNRVPPLTTPNANIS